MTETRDASRPEETTHERILRHAIARFSTQSYENTGLREIATDAGVDVAWVHRSFGSKEKLFYECVRTAITSEKLLSDGNSDTFERLFNEVLLPRRPGEFRPIDIVVRSFSSREASRVIREIGTTLAIDPIASASEHGSKLKVALSFSMLFGFAIMRDIIGISALTEAPSDELKRLLIEATRALNEA
jgi:AcrR family transcriptional regulator